MSIIEKQNIYPGKSLDDEQQAARMKNLPIHKGQPDKVSFINEFNADKQYGTDKISELEKLVDPTEPRSWRLRNRHPQSLRQPNIDAFKGKTEAAK